MKEEEKVASSKFRHTPVLGNEILTALTHIPKKHLNQGWILDATIGGGGHAELLLSRYPGLNLIGIDQDPAAISAASDRLKKFQSRTKIVSTNFAEYVPKEKITFIVADLGVSTPQLTNASRGFSFLHDGPIDMRMDNKNGMTARELIETLNERDLADLIYQYGEEKFSRRIAQRIKRDISQKGSYSGTVELAYAISGCYPAKLRHGRIHPATKTFQALRIATNAELKSLEGFLTKAPNWLIENGIFCIISFHSLEDRLVKNSFRMDSRLERIHKKPITASIEEVSNNPKSRSAKLRISRKIEDNYLKL